MRVLQANEGHQRGCVGFVAWLVSAVAVSLCRGRDYNKGTLQSSRGEDDCDGVEKEANRIKETR